ncbi:MAG: hypothetical protein J6X61_02155, partial [Clostridia bacterium]|nr:hypothetical protein [Clostridia bacterium]
MKRKAMKKHLTALILALVIVLIATGVVTLAEYVKSSRSKRVLAAIGSEGAAFSSNYLLTNADPNTNVYKRILYTSAAGISASGDVTVCNYPQGNLAAVYGEDIEYSLTARLVVLSETGGVYSKTPATAGGVDGHYVDISFNGGTPVRLNAARLYYEFGTSTLDHHHSATDIVSLTFDGDFADAGALCLYLIATPTSALPGITALDAVFSVALSAGETRSTWTGEFNENTSTGTPQPGYDGFNYTVSGNGTGTVTLTWDNTKV